MKSPALIVSNKNKNKELGSSSDVGEHVPTIHKISYLSNFIYVVFQISLKYFLDIAGLKKAMPLVIGHTNPEVPKLGLVSICGS